MSARLSLSARWGGKLQLFLAVFWMVPVYPITLWVTFTQPTQWGMALLQFYSLWALTASHWAVYAAWKAEQQAKETRRR